MAHYVCTAVMMYDRVPEIISAGSSEFEPEARALAIVNELWGDGIVGHWKMKMANTDEGRLQLLEWIAKSCPEDDEVVDYLKQDGFTFEYFYNEVNKSPYAD